MNTKDPKHIKVGKIGEELAVKHLEEKGHEITERNYRKPYGEIDIVATKNNVRYFFEVKTLSRETSGGSVQAKPEDAVHYWKIQRLKRVIQAYLLEKDIENGEWEFGVVSV